MSITRAQVADLQPGDVVELRPGEHPGVVVTGPLHATERGHLQVGTYIVRLVSGEPLPAFRDDRTLTVVSRAPRPLYMNSDRTEPVPGDIVNYKSGYSGATIGPFLYTYTERWAGSPADGCMTRWVGLPGCGPDTGPIYNPGKLRLLVDGTTGQVVP